MTHCRVGHASDPDWQKALAQALAAIDAQPGSDAAGTEPLGVLYVTIQFAPHLSSILEVLRERSGITHWVGGAGEAVCGNLLEYRDEPALVVMLADLPRNSFRVFSGRQPAPQERWHAALVHADPDTPDLAELVADAAMRADTGHQFGAIVGSGDAPASQVADGILSGGLSGVLFDERVPLLTRVTQGCAALAGEHRISDCSAHFIEALDGRPALDVLLDDLGVADELGGSLDGEEILRALPAQRLRGGLLVGLAAHGARSIGLGDFLVRNIVGIDPRNRLLAIAGTPREGDRAIFCTRDADAARLDLVRICTELRSELEEAGVRPRGALYHSCVGRGEHLFGARGAELALIRHNLGEVPLAGIHANGEIAGDRIHGYSGVLTLFT